MRRQQLVLLLLLLPLRDDSLGSTNSGHAVVSAHCMATSSRQCSMLLLVRLLLLLLRLQLQLLAHGVRVRCRSSIHHPL